MSRFESPSQIVRLFLVASLLSIGVIYFIRAEQQSRLRHIRGADEDPPPVLAPEPPQPHHTFLFTIRAGLVKVLSLFKNGTEALGERVSRFKRNSPSKYAEGSSRDLPSRTEPSSNYHRIRHALKKLDGGGLEGDVVYRMILDSIPLHPPKQPERSRPVDLQHWEVDLPDDPVTPRNTPTTSTTPYPQPIKFEPPVDQSEEEEESESFREESDNQNFVEASQPLVSSTSPQLSDGKNLTSDPVVGLGQVKRSAVSVDVCYGTDDVLVVIGITCSLNFAFVLVIWACVRWCSSTKEKDFQTMCMDGDEGGGGSLEEDDFWLSTSGTGAKGPFNPNPTTSTISLYTIRQSPPETLRKSHSYSMEDLRYVATS